MLGINTHNYNAVTAMEARSTPAKSKGRRKIPIETISDKSRRHVTFSKRRVGLFKKAAELGVLTGADVAVVTFSEAGKLFSFGIPNADAVLYRYVGGSSGAPPLLPSPSEYNEIASMEYKDRYGRIVKQIEEEKQRLKASISDSNDNGGYFENDLNGSWWNYSIDELELDELEYYVGSLEELRNKVALKVQEIDFMDQGFINAII